MTKTLIPTFDLPIRKRLKSLSTGKTNYYCFTFNAMIYYIVYLSAGAWLYSDLDIADILTVSCRNNAARDVTGILLYHEGSILQVLEGEQQTVKDLYQKIKKDERHKDVIQLVQGTCEERNFGDWSMSFKAVNNSDWNEYEGYMKLDTAGLLSLIKKKNPKVDSTIKTFVTHTMHR